MNKTLLKEVAVRFTDDYKLILKKSKNMITLWFSAIKCRTLML